MMCSKKERVRVQTALRYCLRGVMTMIEGFHHDNETGCGFRSSGSLCCPV